MADTAQETELEPAIAGARIAYREWLAVNVGLDMDEKEEAAHDFADTYAPYYTNEIDDILAAHPDIAEDFGGIAEDWERRAAITVHIAHELMSELA